MRFHLNQWISQRMVCKSSNYVILIIPFTNHNSLTMSQNSNLRSNYKNNKSKLLILFVYTNELKLKQFST